MGARDEVAANIATGIFLARKGARETRGWSSPVTVGDTIIGWRFHGAGRESVLLKTRQLVLYQAAVDTLVEALPSSVRVVCHKVDWKKNMIVLDLSPRDPEDDAPNEAPKLSPAVRSAAIERARHG